VPSPIPLKVLLPPLAAVLILEQAVAVLQIKSLNPFLTVEVIQLGQQLHFIEDPTELVFMTYLSHLIHFAVGMAEQLLLLGSLMKSHLMFLIFGLGEGLFS
jgi:hypothetical protein